MITDFRRPGDLDLPSDAVLVVGTGPAGLAAALRLGELGHRVVLVESGGDLDDTAAGQAAQDLNRGDVVGLPFALQDGRARGLGGTSGLWHGQCMRLLPVDVAVRPWVASSGWPLGMADLAPHYADAERWLDVSGRGYEADRWAEHERLAPVPWDPRRLEHDFTEYLRSPVLGRTHHDQLDRHRLVTVLLNATVAAVRLQDGRAVGVELRGTDGRRAELAGRDVVLAAGSVENARLLQLSDPAGTGLGDGREHTGRYLQDHPIIRTARVRSEQHRVLQDRYVVLRRDGRRLFPKVRLSEAAQRQHRLLDATAVFVHDLPPGFAAARRLVLQLRDSTRPQHLARDVRLAAASALPLGGALARRALTGRTATAAPEAVWLQVWVEQAPDPARRVDLGEEVDALGLRRARVRWSCDDLELQTSRRLTRWIGQDLVRLGIGHLEELPAMTNDDAWRSSVMDAAHPAGTTRMSTTAADGVVDTDLQVHGVPGLHVVGGSVFPTSGYANPTLTIVALALRLAGRLAGAQREVVQREVPPAVRSSSAAATTSGSGSAPDSSR